jgi:alpha-L-rhamnosidase
MHNGPVSNAFVVNDLRIMTETAHRFADTQSERRYAEQLARSRAAYIRTYIKRDGTMREDYQGAYIMALQMVVDRKDPLWTSLYEKLKGRIRRDGMQTGFYSTAYLLPMLAENGDANLSFDLLLNERYPGWIYEVDHGATTIWERWDGIRENGTVNESDQNGSNMVSFNHYAFGSVGWFMYRDILGIQPLEPGFAKVRIAPHMDARLGFAKGSYQSVHGEIRVEWKAERDHLFVVKITTPVETVIELQDGTSRSVSAGSYEYEVRD